MTSFPRILVALSVTLPLLACIGGASLNENQAGGDGWLDHEDAPTLEADKFAHDGRCSWTGNPYVGATEERAYTMLYTTEAGDCAELHDPQAESKTIWSLAPGDAAAQQLIDVSGHEDVRLLDSQSGLVLMGEVEGQEKLYLIDHNTLDVTKEVDTPYGYWGTRTSSTRRWIAAGDNNEVDLSLHVLDSRTLESTPIDAAAWTAEAMWLHHDDALAAIVMDSYDDGRLLLWDFDESVSIGQAGLGQLATSMPTPRWEIRFQGEFVMGFGYSWIGVDPFDRFVVFPVVQNDHYTLLIVDTDTGDVRAVPDATGPVGFTPDGASIVAWDPDRPGQLSIIDPVTLDRQGVPLSLDGIPTYFMSHEGNQMVVADALGRDRIQIFDLETSESITLDVALPLHTFSARGVSNELYLIDAGLWRIDIAAATAEEVSLDWTPNHVVWMPQSDLLLLDDSLAPRMILWDPNTEEVVTNAPLDDGRRSAPRLSLAR